MKDILGIGSNPQYQSMNSMTRDWSSGLPLELLLLILDFLNCFDRSRFSAVCCHWRAAHHHSRRPGPHLPWLMLSDDLTGRSPTRRLYGLSEPDPQCKLHLHEIRGLFSIGSSLGGWLTSVDHRAELHLFNPLTKLRIPLPSVATLPVFTDVLADDEGVLGYTTVGPEAGAPLIFHEASYIRDYYLEKLVLSPSPSPTSFAAVLIYGPLNQLAVARAGDERWTPVEGRACIQDAIFHQGQLWAVDAAGVMMIRDLGQQPMRVALGRLQHEHEELMQHRGGRRYLVECGGEVLLVLREVSFVQAAGGNRYEAGFHAVASTRRFKVYKLLDGPTGMRWVEAKGLGEHALFLGMNQSVAFSTRDLPALRANCIYFTDDYKNLFVIAHHGRRDVGVYNMEEDRVTAFCHGDSGLNWPPPIWFFPSI